MYGDFWYERGVTTDAKHVHHSLILVRHGETEWSRVGKHTGRSDLPLTERGRAMAASLAEVFHASPVARVFTSPLMRARDTCTLAGLGEGAVVDPDLAEWNYGQYEGKTTAEIRSGRPGWWLWRDGCPDGEMGDEVAARADRAIARALIAADEANGDVALFAHGHLLRVLAARWLGLPAERGRSFGLGPATVSRLGFEHDERIIDSWNASSHLSAETANVSRPAGVNVSRPAAAQGAR